MNKHIELVKRWIADNDSVSNEELTDNSVAAYTAWVNAKAYADARGTARIAANAAEAAAEVDYAEVAAAEVAAAEVAAAYWVKQYEELTDG